MTLATLDAVDCAALNRSFGTSLSDGDFEVRIAPARYQRVLHVVPTQGALLECNLTVRWARALDRESPYDVLFSTQNEAGFGRPAIQYIHYPAWYLPRPDFEMKWFHKIPGLLATYRAACFRISGATREGMSRNLSVVNSAFVAERTREIHGGNPVVVHPPVPGDFPEVPWTARRAAFAAVGRFSEYKRWPMAVAIVDAVRARGHELGLTLIGQIGNPADVLEKRRLENLAATRPWFRILTNLTREQLTVEMANHRYGIHTMEEEHFGIAVAELQRAGCITFVHNSGGPVEIVGNDPRLTFDRIGDGAEKIAHGIEDTGTQDQLRALVGTRRDCFSTERFCAAIREIVAAFPGRRS